MLQVQVIGSSRASAGVQNTVSRVRDALLIAGVPLCEDQEPGDGGEARIVVDPAAWYAAQDPPPSPELLSHFVGYSLAAYGTPAMQDDAAVGRLLAAIAHPDLRAVTHLARLGCRAVHVALGCRPRSENGAGKPVAAERPVAVVTLGPATARRLRVLAHGAPWFDTVTCAHHFDRELEYEPLPVSDPIARARVFLDIAPDDDAPVDPVVLLAAWESGTAIATERLGRLPCADDLLVRAPLETLFSRALELASDPSGARDQAAAGRRALVDTFSLAAMGDALAALLDEASGRAAGSPATSVPDLSHHASAPDPPRTIVEQLRVERERPDAAVRDGIQQIVTRMRSVEDRLARIEQGADAEATDLIRRPEAGGAPAVSVIVPAFNARHTLLETLDSIAATAAEPGAPELEVVLVDDASPQRDGELAAAWAADHPLLAVTILRHRRNRGLSSARNTAVEHAAGELILPLDADDLLREHGLARLLAGLDEAPDATFSWGIMQRFDTAGPVGLVGLYPWDVARMRTGNYIPALALIRRAALVKLGGYAVDMPWGYEDWDLWCRVAEDGGSGRWVPEIVASYRQRVDSMSVGLHLSHLAPLGDMVARHPELLG